MMQSLNFDTPYQVARCLTIASINAIIDMLNLELKKREMLQGIIQNKNIKHFLELACDEQSIHSNIKGESL